MDTSLIAEWSSIQIVISGLKSAFQAKIWILYKSGSVGIQILEMFEDWTYEDGILQIIYSIPVIQVAHSIR